MRGAPHLPIYSRLYDAARSRGARLALRAGDMLESTERGDKYDRRLIGELFVEVGGECVRSAPGPDLERASSVLLKEMGWAR